MKTGKIKIPFILRIKRFFGARIVALKDFDGEVNYRVAYKTPFGWRATRLDFLNKNVKLMPDGTTTGASYVKNWVDIDPGWEEPK